MFIFRLENAMNVIMLLSMDYAFAFSTVKRFLFILQACNN